LQKNFNFIKKSYQVSTLIDPESEQVNGINKEIRDVLRKDVLEAIEEKDDKQFKKKLNYIGSSRAIILNVAPPSLLKNLNSENLFRVLSKQLPNNWSYYWFEKKKMEMIQQNG